MNSYVIMLVEASIAMVLFYTVYYLWLRKETFFQLNRFYLIWAIGISLLIPLINIPLNKSADSIVVYNLLETISISAKAYEQSFITTLSTSQWISTVYLLGIFVFTLRFLYRLWLINRMAKKSIGDVQISEHKNIRFINADVVPFSFLNRIYINPNLYTDEQLNKIIAHETVHINQLHTVDSIMYELLIILFWFNPIAYRYRESAKELHEYLADQGVVKSGFSPISYQKLLFDNATGFGEIKLANSFNYSLIKRRLVMLTKIESSKMAKVRILWVLPVLLSVILVFACNEQEASVIDTYKSAELGEVKVYDHVDEMPEYPGGDQELRMYIAENVKYPGKAASQGIEGRVFIKFIVDENGKVVNPTIERGVNELLDKEALRVISTLPNWTAGKLDGENVSVQFTVPINFKLSGDCTDGEKSDFEIIKTKDEQGNEYSEKIYFTADEMPEYPGGELALRKFIAMNIKYPEKAKETGTEGKIFVQFVVNEEGNVQNVKYLATRVPVKEKNEIGEVVVAGYTEDYHKEGKEFRELQDEAIRVVGSMDQWKPGMKEGKPVKVSFTLPINFALN